MSSVFAVLCALLLLLLFCSSRDDDDNDEADSAVINNDDVVDCETDDANRCVIDEAEAKRHGHGRDRGSLILA